MTDLITTIDTHLEAYGEPDAERRATLVAQVWADGGLLVDPPFDAQGHEAITAIAGALQGQFPAHAFRRTSAVDAHHAFARYQWELVAPDGTVALAGTDVAEVDEAGRLVRIVGFLGDLPAA